MRSGADRFGGRSLSFVSRGATTIVVSNSPARLFRTIVAGKRSDPRYAKGFTTLKLGDEGYSWDDYNLGSGGRLLFNGHVLLFRIGSRMYTVEDEKRQSSITAAMRLALAKVVVQNARQKS